MQIDHSQLDAKRSSPAPLLLGLVAVVLIALMIWPKGDENPEPAPTPEPRQQTRLELPEVQGVLCPTAYTAKPGRWATYIRICADVDPAAGGQISGVKQLILWLPHAGEGAAAAYNQLSERLGADGHRDERALMVPQIPDEAFLQSGGLDDSHAFWAEQWWSGITSSRTKEHPRRVRQSAFLFIDGLVNDVLRRGRLPDLESIIIAGQGDGAAAVTRLLASFQAELPAGVAVEFLALDPPHFLYLNGTRIKNGEAFVPEGFVKSMCPRYNDWPFGLDRPYTHVRGIGSDVLANNAVTRPITALFTKQGGEAAALSCPGRMQGATPESRWATWLAHRAASTPSRATEAKAYAVVEGDSSCLMAILIGSGADTACKPL